MNNQNLKVNKCIINAQEAKSKILSSINEHFTVTFVKKSNGSLRTMNCSLNTQPFEVGGKSSINKDYQIAVVDTDIDNSYPIRSFDINTLTSLEIDQQTYIVK
tara:strand:+ start:808 stop:1116 length:309 start_codon:yes stop_codon:yes gene_type:complete